MKKTGTLAIGLAILTTTAYATGTVGAERRPFGATVEAHSTVAGTSDPCVLTLDEGGAGIAAHMGKIAWAASETLNVCNPGGAIAAADFVMTAANGDEAFGRYESVVRLNPQTGVFTFSGHWDITGGTGRFQGAVGAGTLSGEGRLTTQTDAMLVATFVGTISY